MFSFLIKPPLHNLNPAVVHILLSLFSNAFHTLTTISKTLLLLTLPVMSFEDSSTIPMMSQDSYVQMDDFDDADETIEGLEIGEHLDLVSNDHLMSDSQTEGSIGARDDPSKNGYGKRGREKKSIVHTEMTVVTLPDGTKMRKCKWCPAKYTIDLKNGSTSNAYKHLTTKCIQRKLHLKQEINEKGSIQSKLSGNTIVGSDSGPCLATWQYNHGKVRELAAHMVLGHEFPFLMMEGVIFNRFLREIYPGYRRITRHMVKSDCQFFYNTEKGKMR